MNKLQHTNLREEAFKAAINALHAARDEILADEITESKNLTASQHFIISDVANHIMDALDKLSQHI